ncbi:hypothetical protein Tco_1275578 [Tanacetum coccineum]
MGKCFVPSFLKRERDVEKFLVFSTWMTFGGNTRDLGSCEKETDKTTALHQVSTTHTERGDGVEDFLTTSERSCLKVDLEPSTQTIDQSAGGKLRDRNAKESWALLEDLALCDNESWNDPRDFAKSVKAISLSQDVPSKSDRRLIELDNQVQRLMEAHLAPKQPIQVNKITSSCEICSGPHDT